MEKFMMFGKYSAESIKGISSDRTQKGKAVIEKAGGKVHAMYGLLGCHDLLIIADFPGVKGVMKASLELTKLTGIGFTTSPAVSVEEFDQLVK